MKGRMDENDGRQQQAEGEAGGTQRRAVGEMEADMADARDGRAGVTPART
jgi:hypothetical protein